MVHRSHLLSVSSVWLAGLLAGCSALVDTKTTQCRTDTDCAGLEGAEPTTRCENKVCVARKMCAQHTDCGADGYCPTGGVPRFCEQLKNEYCTDLYPPEALKDENVLLLGMLAALSGKEPYGEPHRDGAIAALRDIQFLGLPPIDGVPPRSLAMLICDERNRAAATRHLVETLKVPAILGASTSGGTKEAVKVTEPKNVLLLSASATSPELGEVGKMNGDLFWRTVPADDQQMSAIRRLFPLVEKAIRTAAAASVPPLTIPTVRITILWKEDWAGGSLKNAAAAASLSSSMDFIGYKEEGSRTDAEIDAEWEMHISTVLMQRPHVIMPFGTTEFVQRALEKIETRWPAGTMRPWYVMPEGSKTKALSTIVERLPSLGLERRVIGTAPGARGGDGWTRFIGSFATNTRIEPGNLAEFAYDAVYLLTYATAYTRKLYPSGIELRDGLAHTNCKGRLASAAGMIPAIAARPVLTGSQGFVASFNAAARRDCIDFYGASGPVDFDDTGETRNNYSLWCSTGAPNASIVSIQTFYDLEKDALLEGAAPSMLDLSVSDWCRKR